MLGAGSLSRLATCDPELRHLVRALAADIDARPGLYVHDITVLCGHRGKADQEAAFARGASKVHWPMSKHNSYPSLAVDLAPYPVDWTAKGLPAFEELRVRVAAVAADLNIKIRHISWDLPHTELVVGKGYAACIFATSRESTSLRSTRRTASWSRTALAFGCSRPTMKTKSSTNSATEPLTPARAPAD